MPDFQKNHVTGAENPVFFIYPIAIATGILYDRRKD